MTPTPARQFTTAQAVRSAVPLWFALFSPSGGGKTFTALRLAKGMQSVLGGSTHMIDTENGRGLHYADLFDYQHTPLEAPFGSLDYLAAVKHVAAQGARVVIIDQLSYEHDGEGGLLDQHEAELDRIAGNDFKKREAVKMLAWVKPKANRKKLIQAMLAMKNIAFILCFRADEGSKPAKNKEGKTEVVHMGFMPIAGKNFVYEATAAALLLPGARGVPTWRPENVGEKLMVKLPEQFKNLFKEGELLSEAPGRALAEWSLGTIRPAVAGKDLDQQRLALALQWFAGEGVTLTDILVKLGRESAEKITAGDLDRLQGWATSVKKKQTTIEALFPRELFEGAGR